MPIIILSALIIASLSLSSTTIVQPTTTHIPSVASAVAVAREIEEQPENIKATVAYVVDVKTGKALTNWRSTKPWPVASLTKVMAVLTLLEQNPDLNKPITLEKEDMLGGTMIRVPVGTRFSTKDLVYATLLGSANNTANALYKATDLSKEEFIDKMNEKARSLGLKRTRFVELSGLNERNISTAHEYALVLNAATQNPLLQEIMATKSYTLRPLNRRGAIAINNGNKLIRQNNEFEVLGGKTGLIRESGYNLAVKAKKGDQELIAVIFDDTSLEQSFKSVKQLLEDGFEQLDN